MSNPIFGGSPFGSTPWGGGSSNPSGGSGGYNQFPLWSNPTTVTLQHIVSFCRTYPDATPVLGVSGFTQEPALTFANDVMQRILAQGMDWKWNRSYVPPILTVALQQDYVTQVTNLGWLENATMVDINNSTNNGNMAPKPIFMLEAVRDIGQISRQSKPSNISFIPNRLAFFGQWYPNTAYGCGYGVAQIPVTPIQQIVDGNGNILYIDSSPLGLNINSSGFTGDPLSYPDNSPYGVSGATRPVLPPNSPAGMQIQDGTVTWTVADPNGYAIRVAPLPPFSGLAWLINPVYQAKPIPFTSLQQYIAPVPPDYTYLFRQGFLAKALAHSGNAQYKTAYAEWEETLVTALRAGDREQQGETFFPSEGLMGGSPYSNGMFVGPGWPFGNSGY